MLAFFWFFAVAQAVRLSPCELELLTYSQHQILSRAGEHLENARMPSLHTDFVKPELGLLESLPELRRMDRLRELQTARDYAVFVQRTRGWRFVLAAQYKGAFVPAFDGLLFDHEGWPTHNISLKYWEVPGEGEDMERLLFNLYDRLGNSHEMSMNRSLMRWLSAVNTWDDLGDEGPYVIRSFERDIERGAELCHIFGLDNKHRHPCGRHLVTVVDMRGSPYSYQELRRSENYDAIAKMVRDRGVGAFSLALLWGPERVLEFY